MVNDAAQFPLPVADDDTRPFWDAANDQRLVVQRCDACGKWIWQPKPLCPACHVPAAWTEVRGRGTVASWTVIHPPVLPAFAGSVPFFVLLVELDEGVRMVGQLVTEEGALAAPPDDLAVGASVVLTWRRQADVTLPGWRLVT